MTVIQLQVLNCLVYHWSGPLWEYTRNYLFDKSLQLAVLHLVQHMVAVCVEFREFPVQNIFVADPAHSLLLTHTKALLTAVFTVKHSDQVRVKCGLILGGATTSLAVQTMRRRTSYVGLAFLAIRLPTARRCILNGNPLGIRAPAAALVHALHRRIGAIFPASWHKLGWRRRSVNQRVGARLNAFCWSHLTKSIGYSFVFCGNEVYYLCTIRDV